ncbi:MAG: hypothetical protein ACPLSJ_02660 [Thermosulfidibacteraceae bacterium]|mgnify:CR=1 FL=1|jgi:hypothetical protein
MRRFYLVGSVLVFLVSLGLVYSGFTGVKDEKAIFSGKTHVGQDSCILCHADKADGVKKLFMVRLMFLVHLLAFKDSGIVMELEANIWQKVVVKNWWFCCAFSSKKSQRI